MIGSDAGERVLRRYRAELPVWARFAEVGGCQAVQDTTAEHCRLVLGTVDAERIRRRRFRVLLDSNHGAGSLLGSQLLRELGCELTQLGETPDGRFAHPAEPTEENLAGVLHRVPAAGADVGFCQDPDADRLAVIDERGRYLGEEYTVALCLAHVLPARPGPVVTNCATSRMSRDLAERYGVPFFRSPVGEAHVTDLMLARGAAFGGEGNGGPIDPRVGYVRDSFVGMALILDAMAARGAAVSELADELPRYYMHKAKFSLERSRTAAALAALERRFPDARPDRLDGLRLDWPGRWLLVRASNTEPIVRAIAEAASAGEARELCAAAGQVLAEAG